jgi:putative pyrimidine permease RutG
MHFEFLFHSLYINSITVNRPIQFDTVKSSNWFGSPTFTFPVFQSSAILTFLPAVIILLAENMGHIATITIVAKKDLNPWLGRSYLGDAVATIISACFGGTGVTTYAENIGVMTMTRVCSSLIFPMAVCLYILL